MSNDDIKAYKGGKDALKGDTDAFTDSDENVVLKSNEEALKVDGKALICNEEPSKSDADA